MVTGDPHVDASLTRLPTQLEEALAHARAERVRPRRRSATCSWTSYLVMLRHELELFARHVTDWERERYREVM